MLDRNLCRRKRGSFTRKVNMLAVPPPTGRSGEYFDVCSAGRGTPFGSHSQCRGHEYASDQGYFSGMHWSPLQSFSSKYCYSCSIPMRDFHDAFTCNRFSCSRWLTGVHLDHSRGMILACVLEIAAPAVRKKLSWIPPIHERVFLFRSIERSTSPRLLPRPSRPCVPCAIL